MEAPSGFQDYLPINGVHSVQPEFAQTPMEIVNNNRNLTHSEIRGLIQQQPGEKI